MGILKRLQESITEIKSFGYTSDKVLDLLNKSKKEIEQLRLCGVSNSFICVKDQEPPRNTELIAQDPKGGNYLTSWRESYKIFMCQSKQEDSYEWKWKQI